MSASQQRIVSADTARAHAIAATEQDPIGNLNLRQWKFARLFAATGQATQSAIDAGYARKAAATQAGVLLQHPDVKLAIDAARAESAERCSITTDSVLRGLVRESTFVGTGASHAARVRALELLGKTLAMFTDQTSVIGSDGKPIDRFAPVFLTIVRNG
jgi:phage terminase small subunit